MIYIAVLAFFLSLQLPLNVAAKLFPQTAGYLPIGGDGFVQAAVLLMIAAFIIQMIVIVELVRNRKKK